MKILFSKIEKISEKRHCFTLLHISLISGIEDSYILISASAFNL